VGIFSAIKFAKGNKLATTTNFEKFKQKMEQSKAKKASSGLNWMKYDAGHKYTLRFLPLKSENLELPISIFNHHAVTFPDGHFESIACPRQTEDRFCPFCDLASKTYRKFTKTNDKEYLEAAKKLFAKKHYLLVGFQPNEIDPANISSDDIKIVRASSQSVMSLIESKLEKEIDFVDFQTGRDVELLKTKATGKNTVTTISWDFGDSSAAFDGKNAKKIWDSLVDASPDLTSVVSPLNDTELAAKFKEFSSTPVEADEELDEAEIEHAMLDKYKPEPRKAQSKEPEVGSEIDLDEMRKLLDED